MIKIQLFIKRLFDVCASFALMLFLIVIPVLIVIPIAIRLTSKGPAVFTQERAGKDGIDFVKADCINNKEVKKESQVL